MEAKILKSSKSFRVRFSEVDSMGIVWHGSYPLYFEDAREQFGADYGIGYLDIFAHGYYAPLVDLQFHYKHPMRLDSRARVEITYIPSPAAKLIFEYEIFDADTDCLIATGRSVQVFLDKDYQLVLYAPDFYTEWKQRYGF